MKNIHSLLLVLLSLVFMVPTQAREFVGANKSFKQVKATAAGCAQATSYRFLDVNNVRARINTGGDMWWDLPGGVGSKYFIPREGTATSMFSGSLWIGGLDVNGQLKLAALRYRQVGNDYWTGPLTVDGTAAIDNETCAEYDKHFKVTRAEVDLFLSWWASEDKEEDFPGYQIPESFYDWPAHGDISLDQSYYLAPFKDVDGDGDYDPENGDYPYYDIENVLCPINYADDPNYIPEPTPETELGVVKGGILVDQILKGDQTLWWVFNDKGDFHTETQGSAIGIEVRGQAFAFATNDVINNMTFYSYEIINRSTFTLTETYFSPWVDTDLGYAWDDYVGCDVGRGLGYCYNGRAVDGSNEPESYGAQPPAIGVDFFQGPYMDPDGLDNPKYSYSEINGEIVEEQIVDESINGVNFGNGIVDDERYGMRRFVYHNNTGPAYSTDPGVAPEYYNFLRGIWKDNTKMLYGGNAHISSGAVGPETDFMFPGDSDPWNWSTGGLPPNGGYNTEGRYWTEEEAGNQYGDRRFMQSAGPFTLRPGAVNYITVGIPWARAASGGPFASVELLRVVDDKCQALFDNCFKVIDGPNAPDLTFTELDQRVIFYISNKLTSNNYGESYDEIDPNIPTNDTVADWDRSYTFEGYQIYQLKDASVSVESLDDPDLSRLVAQFDIKNGIGRLINFEDDKSLNASVPKLKVDGADNGIQHSFILTEDAFAEGAKQLVNHKQYYFMALAYAHNNYLTYSQDPGVLSGLLGQKLPYLSGRKNIKTYTVIPHRPVNGAVMNSEYGDQPQITRIEGRGNGKMILELTEETIDEIMSKPPADSTKLIGSEDYPIAYEATYEIGNGPIDVRVIDPLNVKSGQFELKFDSMYYVVNQGVSEDGAIIEGGDTASMKVSGWKLKDLSSGQVYASETTILTRNEQVFADLGFSVNLEQIYYPGPYNVGKRPDGDDELNVYKVLADNNNVLSSQISFADSSQNWYFGYPDDDVIGRSTNWIRAGVTAAGDVGDAANDDMNGNNPWDPASNFEGVVGSTWAPYSMTASTGQDPNGPAYDLPSKDNNKLSNLASIDFVITSDRSKWSRCPVIEMSNDKSLSQGNARRFFLRKSPSIDKDGNFASDTIPSTNEEDASYISGTGMGWFPGYAINVETGERLNIMYGEDSWLSAQNGRDMQWNPTFDIFNPNSGDYLFGGKHYIYVMKPHYWEGDQRVGPYYFPAYDAGASYRYALEDAENNDTWDFYAFEKIYESAMWVTIPLADPNNLLATDVNIKIRIAKPYDRNYSSLGIPDSVESSYGNMNNKYPMYHFSTENVATTFEDEVAFDEDLDMIRVVPNPYYAYSTYETVPLDNRVKITNLPDKCTVTIYTLSGTEVRQFNKDNTLTEIEWDLKNFAGVPIAGGMYLVHIETEQNGAKKERVLKWFGMTRVPDLNTF